MPSRRGAIVLLALLALVSAACASKRGSDQGQRSEEGKRNVTVLTEGGASGKTGKTGTGGKGGSGTAGSSSQEIPPQYLLTPGPDGSYDIPNFVKVEVPEYESWGGETCAPPHRGSVCQVPFHGSVWSKAEGNQIVFLAFENGADRPAAVHAIPAKKGITRVVENLTYTVGLTTQRVTFRVILRDPNGNTLAENFPKTYGISS